VVPGTLTSLDYALLVPQLHREARDVDKQGSSATKFAPALRLVGAKFLLTPSPVTRDVVVRQQSTVRSRVWIAERVEVMPCVDAQDVVAVRARTREVLARLTASGEPPVEAVVESAAPWPSDRSLERDDVPPASAQAEFCKIIRDDVTQLELSAVLQKPSLVVLADAYDPHWHARHSTTGEELPIVRTNRVLRGVWLPAGEHRIVFEYCPRTFYLGASLSGVAWLALVAGFATSLMRRLVVGRRKAAPIDPR
jgi:hypothetical protein